ncbi:MAG TPA: sugar phosphate isomerase/epimerase [Spirochaetia bacterium]|nr:sugar phosphate isomerase/epimerase [Spirochaetia bacterium]
MNAPETQIALELYTIRDSLTNELDFAKAMAKTRAAGYEAVELAGVSPDIPTTTVKKILDDYGIVCMATQVGLPQLTDGLAATIDDLATLECNHTALAAGPKEMRSEEGYREIARQLTEVGKELAERDIKVAYHNHAFEFERYGDRTGFDIIYDESDPKYLEAKIDTAWMQKGGADVVEWIRRLAGRMTVIHFKDYTIVDNEITLAEVGEGNLNWPGIIAASRNAGIRWYVVEQDQCSRDPFESIRISYDNLVRMGLK